MLSERGTSGNKVQNQGTNTRRSTRLSLKLPVVITSLDAAQTLKEKCHTAVINAHGCGVLTRKPLEIGTRVAVELESMSRKSGQIVISSAIGGGTGLWLLGLEFDEPGNCWGIKDPAQDWNE